MLDDINDVLTGGTGTAEVNPMALKTGGGATAEPAEVNPTGLQEAVVPAETTAPSAVVTAEAEVNRVFNPFGQDEMPRPTAEPPINADLTSKLGELFGDNNG